MQLQTEIIAQTVGTNIQNDKGESLGQIVEVTYSDDGEKMHYLILSTDHFYGNGCRYFAIPASAELVKITEGGQVKIKASKDELKYAKGLSVEKCPKPNLQFAATIYELFNYEDSKHKKNGNA